MYDVEAVCDSEKCHKRLKTTIWEEETLVIIWHQIFYTGLEKYDIISKYDMIHDIIRVTWDTLLWHDIAKIWQKLHLSITVTRWKNHYFWKTLQLLCLDLCYEEENFADQGAQPTPPPDYSSPEPEPGPRKDIETGGILDLTLICYHHHFRLCGIYKGIGKVNRGVWRGLWKWILLSTTTIT